MEAINAIGAELACAEVRATTATLDLSERTGMAYAASLKALGITARDPSWP